MEENKKKENGCECGAQTPEMTLWAFIGFIIGILVSAPFEKKWLTIISGIFFASLFNEICRRRQLKKSKKT